MFTKTMPQNFTTFAKIKIAENHKIRFEHKNILPYVTGKNHRP